jgi:hypothetical protein
MGEGSIQEELDFRGGRKFGGARGSKCNNKHSDTTTNRVMARPHSLVMKHKSIYTIYYEWYGLKNFENLPVDGAIASLEAKYKTK